MVIGVAPSPTRKLQMLFTLRVDGAAARRPVDRRTDSLSLEEAYGVRWGLRLRCQRLR